MLRKVCVFAGLTYFGMAGMVPALADDAQTQEMRSLDEQVQEVKSDVLGIARELAALEERLLYPSGTQMSIFVEVAPEETFRLDSVEVAIDGELATHYIYSFKELEALQGGGIQRLYTGNVASGGHELSVAVRGKLRNGREVEATQQFSFSKDVEPQLLGLRLADAGSSVRIEVGEW